MIKFRTALPNRLAVLLTALVVIVGVSSCSQAGKPEAAGKYPSKNLTLTVQAAAGGGSDTAARTIAKVMEKKLDQSIVVENRPGASGSIAIKHVAGQDADGYHIGFVPVEIAMFEHLGIDVSPDDIDFLGEIMTQPGTIAVPADSPYKTLDDLMKAAKTKELAVSNSGAGSSWEAATKLLGQAGDVTFKPVPFDGGAPAVNAAMGGKVDAVVAGAGETHPGVENGKLRVLAIFSEKPHPVFTDIPTASDEGYDVVFGAWGGLYAPKGLPEDVKSKLEQTIAESAQDPQFTDVIGKTGTVPEYKDSAEFTEFVKSEHARLGEVLGHGG